MQLSQFGFVRRFVTRRFLFFFEQRGRAVQHRFFPLADVNGGMKVYRRGGAKVYQLAQGNGFRD